MPEWCDECPTEAVVMVQDITNDYDPQFYCRDHDPRRIGDEGDGAE